MRWVPRSECTISVRSGPCRIGWSRPRNGKACDAVTQYQFGCQAQHVLHSLGLSLRRGGGPKSTYAKVVGPGTQTKHSWMMPLARSGTPLKVAGRFQHELALRRMSWCFSRRAGSSLAPIWHLSFLNAPPGLMFRVGNDRFGRAPCFSRGNGCA